MSPTVLTLAALALLVFGLICAYYAATARHNTMWGALVLSAVLATASGHLVGVLYL